MSNPRKDGSRYEAMLVALMFGTWGAVFLDRMAQLYLSPFIVPDLQLSGQQIGFLTAVTAVSWGISSFAFGLVSDRFGRRRILIPMVFLFSLLSCASGLARNFGDLLIIRGLMGMAEGPCWSIINVIVEQSSAPERRGRNVGIVVSAAAAVGLAAAPVLTTQIAALHGWRTAFVAAGLPGIVLGGLIWRFVKEPAKSAAASHKASFAEFLSLLKCRNIQLCCLGAAGFVCWLLNVNVFAPLYIVKVAHQAPTTAGFLLGAAGIGSLVVGFLSMTLSDRIGRRPVLTALAVLSACLPLALLISPLYAVLPVLAALLFLTQGGQGISATVMVLVPTESVPPHLAATAIGLVTMSGEIIGGTITPAVAGRLADEGGLHIPLLMASGAMVVVFIVARLLRENRP